MARMIPRGAAALVSLLLLSCGGERREAGGRGREAPEARAGARTDSAAAARPVIVFLGTSLTAGLGVEPDSAYPAVIQRRLDSLHALWRVVNGGVSGETSAGLLRRLEWQLQGPVRVVVIESGANDGLRGLDVDSTRANLEAIIAAVRARDSSIRIVLAGMESPPNMGPRFTTRFRALFPELARREHLPLIPFLLEGVAGIDSLNQGDGIHPSPRGHRVVAENVWRVVWPVIREGAGRWPPAAGASAPGRDSERP